MWFITFLWRVKNNREIEFEYAFVTFVDYVLFKKGVNIQWGSWSQEVYWLSSPPQGWMDGYPSLCKVGGKKRLSQETFLEKLLCSPATMICQPFYSCWISIGYLLTTSASLEWTSNDWIKSSATLGEPKKQEGQLCCVLLTYIHTVAYFFLYGSHVTKVQQRYIVYTHIVKIIKIKADRKAQQGRYKGQ